MYDALIKKVDGSIDYIKIIDNKLVGLNFSKSGVRNSNIEDLIILFKSFLYNKDCIFIGHYKDYEIHYDKKTQLKHFMINGRENFELLFRFNGFDAMLYDGPRLEKHKSDKDILKGFIIDGALIFVCLGSFLQLFTNIFLPRLFYDVNTTSYAAHYVSKSSLDKYDKVDYKKALEFIKNSDLDSETKEYLMNEDLLKDVFQYYKNTPLEYTANLKFEDLKILSYDDEKSIFISFDEWSEGTYNSLYPDKIFVKDMNHNSWYFHVVAHEFIHLLQAEGLPYNYIVESSAELVASEYFGVDVSSYKPAVDNLKLLIDIVGPEPVLKMIFGGDDKQLLEIFKNNLSFFDYNELKNALCTGVKIFKEDDAEVHDVIRDLLCKLYKGINGKDIREDTNIMYDLIYDRNKYAFSEEIRPYTRSTNYYYLNARKMDKNSYIYLSEIDCDKLVDDGYLKEDDCYECHKYNITLDEYYDILSNGYFPSFTFNAVVSDDYKIVGVWNYEKNMFELFDKPVLVTDYNTGVYKHNNLSKFISLEEAVKSNYVNINVMDFISKDKYNTSKYKDWEIGNMVYYSTLDNIIYDISCHRVIVYKPGIDVMFKDQYDRILNHTNQDIKVL